MVSSVASSMIGQREEPLPRGATPPRSVFGSVAASSASVITARKHRPVSPGDFHGGLLNRRPVVVSRVVATRTQRCAARSARSR
jgi:hypothetical protein